MDKQTEKLIVSSVEGGELIDKLIINNEYCNGYGFWEGSLIDNYMAIGIDAVYNGQVYDTIVFLETYANCHSSKYTIILTNDKQVIDKYDTIYHNELDILYIMDELENDNTLTILEETGKLSLDYIDEDVENFMEAVERFTGWYLVLKNDSKGQYIAKIN